MKVDLSRWPTRWRHVRGFVGVCAVTWGMFTGGEPRPGLHGQGLLIGGYTVVAGGGWLGALVLVRWPRLVLTSLILCMAGGLVIFATGPNPIGIAYVAFAAGLAVTRLDLRLAWWLAGIATVALEIIELLGRHNPFWMALGGGAVIVSVLSGTIRRQADDRAEQRELLLAETQKAREEQARSAALAERARIAREIHDVLAHTLTALSVQLETVDALLDRDRTAQARETVTRAKTLMREGLAETRRAISALRDDAPPLPQLLRMLAETYEADTGARSTVEVNGSERPVTAEAALTLYRTAQEAVTNVRKHAPGAALAVCLAFEPAAVQLTVTSTDGGPPAPSAYARVGGYGLTGLRERAELAGGSFAAAPVERGWRVGVMIPT